MTTIDNSPTYELSALSVEVRPDGTVDQHFVDIDYDICVTLARDIIQDIQDIGRLDIDRLDDWHWEWLEPDYPNTVRLSWSWDDAVTAASRGADVVQITAYERDHLDRVTKASPDIYLICREPIVIADHTGNCVLTDIPGGAYAIDGWPASATDYNDTVAWVEAHLGITGDSAERVAAHLEDVGHITRLLPDGQVIAVDLDVDYNHPDFPAIDDADVR